MCVVQQRKDITESFTKLKFSTQVLKEISGKIKQYTYIETIFREKK